MATVSATPDFFRSVIVNTVDSGYSKNTVFDVGQNNRGDSNAYVKETLLQTSAVVDALPGSATITAVDIEFDVDSWNYSVGAPTVDIIAYAQDKADWADDGSTTPDFDTFGTWSGSVWTSSCGSISLTAGETGHKTISCNTSGVAFFQGMYDGTYDQDAGVMISHDPGNFNFWWSASAPIITITYTAGGGGDPVVRRIFIV